MSNQDTTTETVAMTNPRHSGTPPINDDSKKDDSIQDPKNSDDECLVAENKDKKECLTSRSSGTESKNDNGAVVEKDHDQQIIQRSESVIKSPSKSSTLLSSPTPVIQVVDTSLSSSQNIDSGDETTTKLSLNTNVETSQTITVNQPQQSPNLSSSSCCSPNGNFLHPISNIAPNNPFLRATSFHSNSITSSNCHDNTSDSTNSESQIVFAPPKLIPTSSFSNKFETYFLKPSILKTSESSLGDLKKPSETISSSKTFISLNKEDIGKIKTPAFIKMSSLNMANGDNNAIDDKNIKNPSTLNDTSKTASKFLFGQKLEDRVVNSFSTPLSYDSETDPNQSKLSDYHLLSFSDVTNCEDTIIRTPSTSGSDPTKTEESTTKMEINCSSSSLSVIKNGDNSDSVFKRKYEVITGEEDEQNVLTIYGKLYAWDTEKASWVEKGRGHLRLNDVIKNEKLCSRLVMRTAGALRLILNAHIVCGMTFELASENCLRFTYVDGIYMIKANPKDIDQLHSAIEHRLREMSKRMKTNNEE